MKILSKIVITVLLVTLSFVLYRKPSFYVVNYYDQHGIYNQQIKLGFNSIGEVNIYQKYKLQFTIDGKKYSIFTDFSESVRDVLKRIKQTKRIYAYRKGKIVRINVHASSFALDKQKLYTPKQLIVIFNNKKYTISYFSFYSIDTIKKDILYVISRDIKKMGIKNIKSIDLVDLEEDFLLVSYAYKLPSEVGVNVTYQEKSQEYVDYSVKYVYTDKLPQGSRKLVRKGKKGKVIRLYKLKLDYDGSKTKELVREQILTHPVNEVVEIGIGPLKDIHGKDYLIMQSTGYTAGVGGVGYYTYTGHRVKRGVAAVDPSIIPLGTELYVEGYGYAKALDIGSAIKGFKIDLYFEDYNQAMQWGRRKVKVYILKKKGGK
ncbi:MAG: 3D domain-containing protein [bacterium]